MNTDKTGFFCDLMVWAAMVCGLSLHTYVLRVPVFYISCSNSWGYEVQKIFDFQDSDLENLF